MNSESLLLHPTSIEIMESFVGRNLGGLAHLVAAGTLLASALIFWASIEEGRSARLWTYLGVSAFYFLSLLMGGPMSLIFLLAADGAVLFAQNIRRGTQYPGRWLILGISYLVLYAGMRLGPNVAYLDIVCSFCFLLIRGIGWPLALLGDPGSGVKNSSDSWYLSFWSSALALLIVLPASSNLIVTASLIVFVQTRPNPLNLTLLLVMLLFKETSAPLVLIAGVALLSLTNRWLALFIVAAYLAVLQPLARWHDQVPTAAAVVIFGLLGRAWGASQFWRPRLWVQMASAVASILALSWLVVGQQVISPDLSQLYSHGVNTWASLVEDSKFLVTSWMGQVTTMLPAFFAGAAVAEVWRRYWPNSLPQFDVWPLHERLVQLLSHEWLVRPNAGGLEPEEQVSLGEGVGISSLFEPVLVALFLGGVVWVGLWL